MSTALDPLAILADLFDPPPVAPEPDYVDGWEPMAHQDPPRGQWRWWLLLGGRGSGKTSAGAHYIDRYARRHPRSRIGIVAPTLGDARETCVIGETGLLAANPAIRFVRSPVMVLMWPNGSRARVFGASTPEDVERLRGPQHHVMWLEELAAWRYLEECWKLLHPGLRLGENPHAVITTTPKPRPRIRRLLRDRHAVVTRATTYDNPYLSATVRRDLEEEYGGTAFEREQLRGELVLDDEAVVVPLSWIERCALGGQLDEGLPVELGVDVGGGGDESVIRERRGPVAGRVWRDRQRDTMRVVGKTLAAIDETGATRVKVDVIGIGAGVADRLAELRRERRHRAEVVRVNVGEASSRPDRFVRLRDELWWMGRRLSEDGGWSLAALDESCVDQLAGPQYSLDSAGRIHVEQKDLTKARIGRSPDDADALLLAFYSPPPRLARAW